MKLNRRQFNRGIAGAAGLAALGPMGRAFAARNDEMNILCWEGYTLTKFSARSGTLMVERTSGQKVALRILT